MFLSYSEIAIALRGDYPTDPIQQSSSTQSYRLFLRAFETSERKSIVILWLGFPRKEGAKDDCYQVFSKMVVRGDFPDSMEPLLAQCSVLEDKTNEEGG